MKFRGGREGLRFRVGGIRVQVGFSGPCRVSGFLIIPRRDPLGESRANARVRAGKYRPGLGLRPDWKTMVG